MISHAHRCIFVHVPRCGGSSIESVLWPGPRTGADLWGGFVATGRNKYQTGGLQHLTAAQIRCEVGAETFAGFLRFAVVRNPWDRAVSNYAFVTQRRPDLQELLGIRPDAGFTEYLEAIRRHSHVQWKPQNAFVDDEDGTPLVDRILRFERFHDDVGAFFADLGVEAAVPHVHETARVSTEAYYDDRTRKAVAQMYAADIERFDYAFPGALPVLAAGWTPVERLVSPHVWETREALRERFLSASPFPHVSIEEFFDETFAEEVLDAFPSARDVALANPYGFPGDKAVLSDLNALGGPFAKADRLFRSPSFLAWLGGTTGIPDLLYDESNFGGGTHENFNNRDLLPHVDFNYHPVSKLHRRVNLIVYLNHDWQTEWGGALRLQRDPRDPYGEYVDYGPVFNRCVIFETGERSWHGFGRIALPEGSDRTRKSLSIYYYTRERAAEETAGDHTTHFVPRPLPEKFALGYTLGDDDVAELAMIVGHRDRLIELYQRKMSEREPDGTQAARLRIRNAELEAARGPALLGFAQLVPPVHGWFEDGWCGGRVEMELRSRRDAGRAIVTVFVPEEAGSPTLRAFVDGVERARAEHCRGPCELAVSLDAKAGVGFSLHVETSTTVNYLALGRSRDRRDLGFRLVEVVIE